jgi:hypothetical protein
VQHSAQLRRCLESADVAGCRRLWAAISPHLPQPKTAAEALIILHHARTQSESIALKLRAWSHRWLLDHGYPSGLPDRLKPSAERLYPRIAKAVGVSVNARSEIMRPVALMIRDAMNVAVLEAFDDGRGDNAEFVKARMAEARSTVQQKLLGRMLR